MFTIENSFDEQKQRPANIGLAIWRLKCFYETFVQGSTAVILMNFCAKNPPHRQAENRCLLYFKHSAMYRFRFLFLSLLMIVSCKNSHDNYIKIGIYSFDFPKEFSLIKGNGIDSYVGKVTDNKISFDFDYGYYSNKLILAPEEYVDNKIWFDQFIDHANMETPTSQRVSKSDIDILEVRKANFTDKLGNVEHDYVATLKWKKGVKFDYPIEIPEGLKGYTIKKDTIQNCLRKIVLAKDSKKGITGIYLQDLSNFNKSINSSQALSMSTSNLTKPQQDSVLKIFNTLKINNLK